MAILGPSAAERLNINRVDNSPAIFIGDEALTVIGVLANTRCQPSLLNAIIIPNQLARDRFNLDAVAEVQIEVEVGAAELIGVQAGGCRVRHPSVVASARCQAPVCRPCPRSRDRAGCRHLSGMESLQHRTNRRPPRLGLIPNFLVPTPIR